MTRFIAISSLAVLGNFVPLGTTVPAGGSAQGSSAVELAIIQMEHLLSLSYERAFAIEFAQEEAFDLRPNLGIDVASHGSHPLLVDGHILLQNGEYSDSGWRWHWLRFTGRTTTKNQGWQ